MNLDATVHAACQRAPGLVHGALVLVPDGFLLGTTRGASILDVEPLVRCAARCYRAWSLPVLDGRRVGPFCEFLFVARDQLVVVHGSRRDPRLALALVCTAEHNIAFVMSATRLVLAAIESSADLAAWGL